MIHVCPLSRLEETVIDSRASHLVTLINKGTPVGRPAEISRSNHLFLGFNDITEPMEGFIPPGEDHVTQFIDFMHGWGRARPVVVHCWAGISRSTAAAFVAACLHAPHRDEHEIARTLRQKSATATPNILFVEIADKLLRRNGRMVEAVAAIGRGRMAFEGDPFVLEIN